MFLLTMWRGRTPSLATAIGPGDRRRDRETRLRVRRTRVSPDRRRGRAPLTERSRLLPARAFTTAYPCPVLHRPGSREARQDAARRSGRSGHTSTVSAGPTVPDLGP